MRLPGGGYAPSPGNAKGPGNPPNQGSGGVKPHDPSRDREMAIDQGRLIERIAIVMYLLREASDFPVDSYDDAAHAIARGKHWL